MTLYLVHKRA